MDETRHMYSLPFVSTKLDMEGSCYSSQPINTARKAVELVAERLYNNANEIGIAIFMDSGEIPICVAQIGKGNEQSSDMSPRDISQIGLLCNASRIIVLHNHPMVTKDRRNLKPSTEDIHLTDAIAKACSLHGMLLIDSIIVSGFKESFGTMTPVYYSMKEHNFAKLSLKAGRMDFQQKLAQREEDIAWGEAGTQVWEDFVPGSTSSNLENYEFLTKG